MNGVVSLLDSAHDRAVRKLWAELAERLGLSGIAITPYPHFSYHVAQAYDDTQLDVALRDVARRTEPFRVQTTGLGVFTGELPVLYLPVVRTRELSTLHGELWKAFTPLASGGVNYYQPATWMPHITLAHGDLDAACLPNVMSLFGSRMFDWEIRIDNFATLYAAGPQHELRRRYTFGS